MVYLDTSLLVAALTNEQDTAHVQAWLAAHDPDRLVISDWVTTEFSSALGLKLRTGQFGPEHRAAALAEFARLSRESLRVLPVVRSQFRLAARFVDQSTGGLRAADALHLAICAETGAMLGTLDRQLCDAAAPLGVNAMLVSGHR
jgi:uncharacterized protein